MKKRKEIIYSTKLADVSSLDNVKSVLGKKIFSETGEPLGRVKDVLFSNNAMLGIIVLKGFKKIFIDKEFLDKGKIQSKMLNVEPAIVHIGKKVFDSKGQDLGKVISANRENNSNNIVSFVVKKIFLKNLL